jgi:hypothetical protein
MAVLESALGLYPRAVHYLMLILAQTLSAGCVFSVPLFSVGSSVTFSVHLCNRFVGAVTASAARPLYQMDNLPIPSILRWFLLLAPYTYLAVQFVTVIIVYCILEHRIGFIISLTLYPALVVCYSCAMLILYTRLSSQLRTLIIIAPPASAYATAANPTNSPPASIVSALARFRLATLTLTAACLAIVLFYLSEVVRFSNDLHDGLLPPPTTVTASFFANYLVCYSSPSRVCVRLRSDS